MLSTKAHALCVGMVRPSYKHLQTSNFTVTRDVRILNRELCCECSCGGWNLPELGWEAETDTVGEQQQSGRNWGAAAEVDAIGEQQLKRTQLGSSS